MRRCTTSGAKGVNPSCHNNHIAGCCCVQNMAQQRRPTPSETTVEFTEPGLAQYANTHLKLQVGKTENQQ